MRLKWTAALIAGAGLFAVTSAASAAPGETGLVGLHSKVVIGRKLCMSDHYHSGNSTGQPSKKAAEVAAIRSWQDFTGWEYGGAWGNYQNAESKRLSCSGSGRDWSCSVDARPCRKR